MSMINSVVNYQWEYKSLKHDTSIMRYEKGMNDLCREGKNGWELVSTVLTDSPTNPGTKYLCLSSRRYAAQSNPQFAQRCDCRNLWIEIHCGKMDFNAYLQ